MHALTKGGSPRGSPWRQRSGAIYARLALLVNLNLNLTDANAVVAEFCVVVWVQWLL